MTLRSFVAVLFPVAMLAHRAAAQTATGAATPIGVWHGTSICLVRPSACHDEIVVYRITPTPVRDSVSMDARKVVNAQEEEMAVLGCRFVERDAALTCTMPNGVWRFTIRRDSLVGELRLPDSTKFRDVRTARSR
jgi:hypothetical protein